MSSGFPTEVVREGRVSVVTPRLKAYLKQPFEYAPSKAPVFYNPVMELNRDVAVLALQVYQKMVDRKISVCEPMTGCGIRGIRFAREVEGIREVVVNDISPEAANLVKLNVEQNELTGRVLVMNEDANLLLGKYAVPHKRFDVIDVDPFGSPAPYLDSAVRALRDEGMLALTATDMAPLCGVHPRACMRKYGGKPLRTAYCHELAVRLLLGCLTMMAAKHDLGIEVVFSHSTDHYIRVYAVIRHGAKKADESVRTMGYVLHCFACLHREKSKGLFSFPKQKCRECGSKMNAAGPLWLGRLIDQNFCSLMQKEIEGKKLQKGKRVVKLLSLSGGEAESPTTYYVVDKICDELNVSVPPLKRVVEELRKGGFQAVPTHFNSRGVKTDAPISVLNTSILAAISASERRASHPSRRHTQSPPQGGC